MTSYAGIDRGARPVPESAIRAEQVRLLFASPAIVVLVNLANAAIAAGLLWRIYPAWILASWLGLVAAVVAARVELWRRFTRRQPADQDAEAWGEGFALGAAATGCLWGFLASIVFMTQDPIYYVFAVFVLGGMTAGASMRDSAYLPAFYGFTAPAIIPIVAALLVKDGFLLVEMGLMLAAFAVVLLLMGRDNNRRIVSNIRLRIEQANVNEDLQRLTADLKKEVADHARVARALEESNERMRVMGASAQDAFVIADSNGNVIYWNPAAERIFGFTAEEMIGRSVHALLVPDRDRRKAIEGYKRFAATGEGDVVGKTQTLSAVRKDGSEVPIDLSVSAMRLGEVWHALGVARDISARVRAEAELHAREAELKETQRLAHLASWVWLREGDAIKWSEELYRMFGRDPALPPPTLAEHAQFLTPESFEHLTKALKACQTAGTPYEIDLEIIRADGTRAWISARGEAEQGAVGGIVRVHGTVQDITERKRAEQSIARLNERMAVNVDALKRHDKDMVATAKLSDVLQACRSTVEAFPIIAAAAGDLFRGTNGALAMTVTGTSELETVTEWGQQRMQPGFAFDDCWALRTGQLYELGDPEHGTMCRHFKSPPRGPCLCLPLTVRGETSSLLQLDLAKGEAIDDELRRRMINFGDVIKLSLSNLKLRESLSEQAIRDQLTGLFNRHYLAETLPREIRRAQRDKTSLSIAMLDIDHFKVFNDTHGHDAGDAVLKGLGAFLRASLRAGDIACRYGGEEFLLVLPECDINDAQKRLQTIFAEIKRKTFTFHRQPLPGVTMSGGISQMTDDLATAEGLIAAADEALYAAKTGGRDRIELFQSVARKTAPAA